MSSRDSEREALHGPWPSPVEELQGLYGERYKIFRELLPSGGHGGWVAHPLSGEAATDTELRASSVDGLARQLAAADAALEERTDE